MVDSGVDSQHKSIFKERNISVTEDDECLSFTEDRFREKNIIMSEEEDETDKPTADDKKDDSDEVSVAWLYPLHHHSSPYLDSLLSFGELRFGDSINRLKEKSSLQNKKNSILNYTTL